MKNKINVRPNYSMLEKSNTTLKYAINFERGCSRKLAEEVDELKEANEGLNVRIDSDIVNYAKLNANLRSETKKVDELLKENDKLTKRYIEVCDERHNFLGDNQRLEANLRSETDNVIRVIGKLKKLENNNVRLENHSKELEASILALAGERDTFLIDNHKLEANLRSETKKVVGLKKEATMKKAVRQCNESFDSISLAFKLRTVTSEKEVLLNANFKLNRDNNVLRTKNRKIQRKLYGECLVSERHAKEMYPETVLTLGKVLIPDEINKVRDTITYHNLKQMFSDRCNYALLSLLEKCDLKDMDTILEYTKGIWTTADSRVIKFTKLGAKHLSSCIKMCKKCKDNYTLQIALHYFLNEEARRECK